ncbi:LxmA leader domain family RiPP [Rhodococcoides corynebacterioides]|uniref:LxmA leader domain family RiPP n=1 Tax=Rhodococcoides corynebacterioides TaxID=53972 RepID=UPI001C9AD151|nr:LxmA leader domain family RiPP [Rhodococcus corynebacterioides]MBY6350953.1 hypothetical protein [Rhodococcus corynebacterioides]
MTHFGTPDDVALTELVGGYREYAAADELSAGAAVDAPASTPFCGAAASFAFSYITTGGPGNGPR